MLRELIEVKRQIREHIAWLNQPVLPIEIVQAIVDSAPHYEMIDLSEFNLPRINWT